MGRREGHAGGNSPGGAEKSYCQECEKDFVQLGMHESIVHHSLPERRCTICGMLFKSPKRLCAHLVNHSSSERRCFECHQKFEGTLELLVHLDDHPSEHIYSCLKCGSGFASRFRLLDHGETTCTDNTSSPTRESSPPPLSETESEGYSTSADSATHRGRGLTVVIGANGFWRHMEAKKMKTKEEEESDKKPDERERETDIRTSQEEPRTENDSTDDSDLHIAESVGTRDSGNEDMKEEDNNNNSNAAAETGVAPIKLEHLKRDPEERTISGFRELKKDRPVRRRRVGPAESKVFRCRFCTKLLSNRKTLKYHELRHTGDLKYKCAKCELRFPALYKLKEHSETHKPPEAKVKNKPEVQHTCHYCERSWRKKHQVVVHLRNRSDCCGRDFGCSTLRAKHAETDHPGERIFSCSQCPGRTYASSAQLKRHRVVVHKSAHKKSSFACPACRHWTTSLHNLRRHQRRNGCRAPYNNKRRSTVTGATPIKQECTPKKEYILPD